MVNLDLRSGITYFYNGRPLLCQHGHTATLISNSARKKSVSIVFQLTPLSLWFALPHRHWPQSHRHSVIAARCKVHHGATRLLHYQAAPSRSFVISPSSATAGWQALVMSGSPGRVTSSFFFRFTCAAVACMKMAWNGLRDWLCK